MLKKILILLLSTPTSALIGLHPEALQKKIVDDLLQKISASSPYQVRADEVKGNLFGRLALEGVHVSLAGKAPDVLSVHTLYLNLAWTALVHRRIELEEVTLVEPVLTVALGPNGTFAESAPASESPESATPLSIERFNMTQGKIRLINPDMDAMPLNLESMEGNASLSSGTLRIHDLDLAFEGGHLALNGQMALGGTHKTSLEMRTRDFPVHRALRMVFESPEHLRLFHSGLLRVEGERNAWSIHSTGQLNQAPLILDLHTHLKSRYDARVTLKALPLKRIWLDPQAGRLGTLTLAADISGPNFTSKAINALGTVEIVQPSTGVWQAPVLKMHAQLTEGRGTAIMGLFAEGLRTGATLQVNLPAERLKGDFKILISSFIGLAEWAPALREVQGLVAVQGSLETVGKEFSVTAQGNAKQLGYQGKTLSEAHFTVQKSALSTSTLTVELSAKDLYLNDPAETPWDISGAILHLEGRAPRWKTNAQFSFRNKLTLDYQGSVEKRAQAWQLAWQSLALSPKTGASLHSTHAGELLFSGDHTLTVHNLELTNGHGFLRLPAGTFKKKFIDFKLSIEDVALASLASLGMPAKKYDGWLNAALDLHGSPRAPEGSFHLQISTGSVSGWAYKEFSVTARIHSPWIWIDQLDLVMPKPENNVHGKGRLPLHLLDAQQPDEPMDVQVQAPHLDPGLLSAVIPDLIVDKGGAADLQISVTGRYPRPDIEGQLNGHFPHLVLAKAGLDVHDFILDIHSHAQTLDVRDISGKTKKGDFHITGQSMLPNLNLTLKGKNVQLHIPKELDARLDLDLLLSGDLEGPDLSGDVRLHEATYTQPQKTKKQKAAEAKAQNSDSSPADGENDDHNSPLWEGTTLNVHASWPRNVWYRDGLTKIETTGDIRVQKDEDSDSAYLTGRISIVRGSYDLYGRDFNLNSGDILFTGPPDINPILNLEASYAAAGTIVYLDLTGTAKEPKPALRSDPPLAENDIISVLIFGHPLNQINAGAGGSGQTQTQEAQAVAGSVLGGYLTKSLRENGMNVGLDVVRVDPTNTGGNRLTVGRYIGQKLFVSYGQPLQGDAVRVFDASYYLSPHWSLVGETGAGTDSYLDLLFRYPLNKPAHSHDSGFVSNTPFLQTPIQPLPFPQPNPAH